MMARTETLVDEDGTRLDIIAAQTGSVGIKLNLLESGRLVKGFYLGSPGDLLVVLAALVEAGSYLCWLGEEAETALGTALADEARRLGREQGIEPPPHE
jgi:hypothetical protein